MPLDKGGKVCDDIVVQLMKGVTMTSQTYITSLERRHQDLERKISEEMRHPARDALLIAALKRKKLELKDQMSKAQVETAH